MPLPPKCLLLTVGSPARGPAAPLVQGLIQAIQRQQPAHFLLMPTRARDSLSVAKQVLRGLDVSTRAAFVAWSEEQPFLCIERHDDPASTRAVVREALREVRRRFPEASIVIRPGSGTRAMAAGAVLAAIDEGCGRVEVTAASKEGPDGDTAPSAAGFDAARWRAETDLTHAARLWDLQQWIAAADLLRSASSFLPERTTTRRHLTGIERMARGFAAKECCQFAEAARLLHEARQDWHPQAAENPGGQQEPGWLCKETASRCARLAKIQAGERDAAAARELLTEWVDQSIRAARLEQFDTACLRLTRAMELDLQLRLAQASGGAIWNGRLAKGGKLPDALRSPAFLAQLQRTEAPRLWSPEATVHALHALGDDTLADLWRDLTDWRTPSEWRQAWGARETSFLGHGAGIVDKTALKNLRKAAGRFLGLPLAETHPLPAFDRRWLA